MSRLPPDSNADRAARFFKQVRDEAMPHVKTINSRVSAWSQDASWRKIGLVGFAILITTAIIGSILDVDREIVIERPDTKPIVITVINKSDGSVALQPSIGGKPGKAVNVDLPPRPDTAPTPTTPTTATAPTSKTTPTTPSTPSSGDKDVSIGWDGIHVHEHGKDVSIDSRGIRVRKDVPPDAVPNGLDPKDLTPKDTAPKDTSAKDAKSGDKVLPESTAAREAAATAAASAAATAAGAQTEAAKEAEVARAQEADAKYKEDVADAINDAKDDLQSTITQEMAERGTKKTVDREGFFLWDLIKIAIVLFFAYVIAIKISTTNKARADAMVKTASKVAEHESLQRQVLEARMQMMQAQVEPHFLFNTLASVDYLIETDPARASRMQKNLIQYLRAALPQMRENATNLGREADLVGAYLEILKVRMEERLNIRTSVPDGLRSADFPPMMLQSLVENAIKHGLEPKPEGGDLVVSAEIVDGDLFVTVADTGLGFLADGAPTSGGGVGLTNIRERLALLYGDKGRLAIEANSPSGTRVTIVVPYQPKAARAAPTKPEGAIS